MVSPWVCADDQFIATQHPGCTTRRPCTTGSCNDLACSDGDPQCRSVPQTRSADAALWTRAHPRIEIHLPFLTVAIHRKSGHPGQIRRVVREREWDTMRHDVIVVGAGLAGMTAAKRFAGQRG